MPKPNHACYYSTTCVTLFKEAYNLLWNYWGQKLVKPYKVYAAIIYRSAKWIQMMIMMKRSSLWAGRWSYVPHDASVVTNNSKKKSLIIKKRTKKNEEETSCLSSNEMNMIFFLDQTFNFRSWPGSRCTDDRLILKDFVIIPVHFVACS